MMSPWNDPAYIKRVWCDFEMYTATHLQQEIVIALPPRQESDFRAALLSGGLGEVWRALGSVKVEHADASVQEYKERILNLIEKGPGFHHLNVAVAEKLQGWIVQASEGYFQEQLELDPDRHDVKLAELGQAIGSLLAEVGHLDRSSSALETAHTIREETNTLQTPDGANL